MIKQDAKELCGKALIVAHILTTLAEKYMAVCPLVGDIIK